MVVPPLVGIPFGWSAIAWGAQKAYEHFVSNSKDSPTAQVKETSERAEVEMRVLLAQAKVEQELAIARRIYSAEEVQIEEFYDTSGKGTAGVSAAPETVTVGLNGEGRRVTKRIIKFSGGPVLFQETAPAETGMCG